jgi:hypothetical protein
MKLVEIANTLSLPAYRGPVCEASSYSMMTKYLMASPLRYNHVTMHWSPDNANCSILTRMRLDDGENFCYS